ncbi:MAG: periplasmic heavy metal sensor [bacterium]
MRRLKVISLISALLIMVCALPLFAEGPGGGPGERERRGAPEFPLHLILNPDIAKEIGLTDSQQDKLHDLLMQHQKSQITLRAKIEVAELELQDLLEQDDPNIKEVDKKIEEIGKLRIEDGKANIHLVFDAKKILKPEQVEKVKSLMSERVRERREPPPFREGAGEKVKEKKEKIKKGDKGEKGGQAPCFKEGEEGSGIGSPQE